MTFPTLTLHEAEQQLAEALEHHDACTQRHDESYGARKNEAAIAELEAEDAVNAARARLECVRSQQPARGRQFHDEVAL